MAGQSSPPLNIGPCDVWFGAASSEVDLGPTHGGVTFNFSHEHVLEVVDRCGITPINGMITGASCTITFALSAPSAATLASLYPGAATEGYGVTFSNPHGIRFSDIEGQLILKPLVSANGTAQSAPSSNTDDYIYVPKAVPIPRISLVFDNGTQRVWGVEFIGLENSATGVIWKFGASG